ncbi:sensor histidine kinase [Pontiella sp.]|uniref:sensor histidine kinase n=1 Tax=Pontiella sp. TaxID=2837462 RepID=UPI00356AF1E5
MNSVPSPVLNLLAALQKSRRLALLLAWLIYILFTLTAYPLFEVSVMLPSILLCGWATWLYGYRVGLLTALLSQPYNALMMIHNTNSPDGWIAALEIGGVIAQLVAVGCTARLVSNTRKTRAINRELEQLIRERETELNEVSSLLSELTREDRTTLSESLYSGVAFRLKELHAHCKELRSRLVSVGLPEAEAAGKLVQVAASSIKQIDILANHLSPDFIRQQGLAKALKQLVEYYSETSPVNIRTKGFDAPLNLHPDTAANLYLIANEGISNALRHSRPANIAIAFEYTDGTFSLTVENDGSPPPEAEIRRPGIGMQLMQQRAGEIGAALELTQEASGTTRLVCSGK